MKIQLGFMLVPSPMETQLLKIQALGTGEKETKFVGLI
jgi:hypothetical protein